jgi:hypothetical protein
MEKRLEKDKGRERKIERERKRERERKGGEQLSRSRFGFGDKVWEEQNTYRYLPTYVLGFCSRDLGLGLGSKTLCPYL